LAGATHQAPAVVRSVLRRLPRRSARGGALGALIYELDIRLTAEASRCS
jgi:hypothetical protein